MWSDRHLRQNRKFGMFNRNAARYNNIERCTHRPARNPEWSSHRTHSHNTGRRLNNPNLNMENLKKGGKENRIL